MKSFKSLTNSVLLEETRSLSSEERRLGIEVLNRLREIEHRKLYATEGFSSLHEFVVKELKYSDGAAHRRVQAMRLLRDLPEIEGSLVNGELTLSNASQLQDFLRAERKSGKRYGHEEKAKLARELTGKSTRQAQAVLMQKSPEAMIRDTLRPISADKARLTVVVGQELQEKLDRIRDLVAHRLPQGAGYAELLEVISDVALRQLDPALKQSRRAQSAPRLEAGAHAPAQKLPGSTESQAPAQKLPGSTESQAPAQKLPGSTESQAPAQKLADPTKVLVQMQKRPSRYIPTSFRSLLWQRAKGRCEHVNPRGERCASRFALQVDHVHPVGKGGGSEFTNLQLLCRTHNSAKNLKDYGFMYVRNRIEN